tara:strand:- start:170 stop:1825 length:1656 start_codon:yes stop_codon:yes gene_type:complete
LGLAILVSPLPVFASPQIGVTAALRGDVVRTASLKSGVSIGQMSSGQQVFLGDDIKVGRKGRLQVMLMDETIFTLGANSVMRIDEFVYDPDEASNNRLSTSIRQGAFRFVSGKISKANDQAMKVKLPTATIGVRGTSVAGDVDADGSASVILLGPAPNNSLGLPAGAINVANAAGGVDITRPGFVTQIMANATPPAPPQLASPAQIQNLERALSEDATQELAEGLGLAPVDLTSQRGTDSDGDGQLDSFASNEALSKAILSSTGSEGGVTNDAQLLEKVANTIFGGLEMEESERNEFFQGVNLGEDIGNLLAGDFEYLGPTSLSDLANFGLNGNIKFEGTGAEIEDSNGLQAGTFGLTQIWDFANNDVSSNITGNFSLGDGSGNTLAGEFTGDTQTVSFDTARGDAAVVFSTSFSATLGPYPYYVATMGNPNVYADVGGDQNGVGAAYYYAPGSSGQGTLESRISAIATLDSASEAVIVDNTHQYNYYQLDIKVNSFLSDVDRKDGGDTTASFGEGGVSIEVLQGDYTANPLAILNKAEGSIFAMKRTVSE